MLLMLPLGIVLSAKVKESEKGKVIESEHKSKQQALTG